VYAETQLIPMGDSTSTTLTRAWHRHRPLPAPGPQRRRQRQDPAKTHPDQPLQRTLHLALPGPQEAGRCRRR